jgi:hypothetical protein
MNTAAYAYKFFFGSGILLIAIAALQMLLRPRAKGRAFALSLLDATTIRAILFVTMGIFSILVGMGVIPLTGGR